MTKEVNSFISKIDIKNVGYTKLFSHAGGLVVTRFDIPQGKTTKEQMWKSSLQNKVKILRTRSEENSKMILSQKEGFGTLIEESK